LKKIVIIDDEQQIRTLLQLILTGQGYEVAVAKNGIEAMNLLSENSPDLIITDIFMPEKDGLEIIQEIRTTNSEVKIIAISGGSIKMNANFLNVAREIRADRALTKPFEIELLCELTKDLLSF